MKKKKKLTRTQRLEALAKKCRRIEYMAKLEAEDPLTDKKRTRAIAQRQAFGWLSIMLEKELGIKRRILKMPEIEGSPQYEDDV